MKERPILFNSEMVKSILEGRKSQTRRIIKGEALNAIDFFSGKCDSDIKSLTSDLLQSPYPRGIKIGSAEYPEEGFSEIICPFGQPGDRLWVRETFWCDDELMAQDIMSHGMGVYYKAAEDDPSIFPKWYPSIHMPRWASRITLEIKNVRVARLQDISEEDAESEGCELSKGFRNVGLLSIFPYKNVFEELWNSIHGPESWSKNPWVWVIEFAPAER